MNKLSRRALARYAAEQLIAGKPAADVAKDLAAIAVEAGMHRQIDFLLGDLAWELERCGELTSARVTTARPIASDLERHLRAELKKVVKTREVALEKSIDKAVVGSIKIETAGRVWDKTVAKKLQKLREAF